MTDSCTCDDDESLVYACQGCGRLVNMCGGIEYATQKPYAHSKWFCSLQCVALRHSMLARYIASGKVNPLEPEVQEYIEALNSIERFVDESSRDTTSVEITCSDYAVKARLRTSGLVC